MPRIGHPPYFPFYPDDFASDGDVEAMSTAQVGAYILLLCKAWREQPVGSVPDDDGRLARWARMTPVEWSEAKSAVLSPFQLRTDGRWHQSRMEREFMKLRESSRRRAEAGAAGAEKRWGNGKRMAKPKQCYSNANATALRFDGMSSSSSTSVSDANASHIRDPSTTEMAAVADAWNMLGVPFPKCARVSTKRRTALKSRLADEWWRANWRAGIERVRGSPFCRGETGGTWVATFEWFIKPDSLTKILEGTYDDRAATSGRSPAAGIRETSAQARERGNVEAVAGFLRRAELRESNAGVDGAQANGGLHGAAIDSVARRVERI